MIENPYQLAYELKPTDVYFLKDHEEFKTKIMKKIIEKRLGLYLERKYQINK